MISVDIAVLGGGPAGAATACALAAAGREVMVLERTAGSRHKVCGEFLSVETLASLTPLGIDPRALGALPIERLSVSTPAGRSAVALPFRALSLARLRLDRAILDRTARLGAAVRQGVSVRAAAPLKTGWQLRCNDDETVCCRILVLATGKRAPRGMADGRDSSMVGRLSGRHAAPDGIRHMRGQRHLPARREPCRKRDADQPREARSRAAADDRPTDAAAARRRRLALGGSLTAYDRDRKFRGELAVTSFWTLDGDAIRWLGVILAAARAVRRRVRCLSGADHAAASGPLLAISRRPTKPDNFWLTC